MLKRMHNEPGLSSSYRRCRTAHTAAYTGRLASSSSPFTVSPTKQQVESPQDAQIKRIRRRLQSFLRDRLKYENFPALDTERYLVFYEQCRKRRRPDQAYAVAANLLARSQDMGEPVWAAGLLHYVLSNNPKEFKATLSSMLRCEKDGGQVVMNQPAILPYALKVCSEDSNSLESVLQIASSAIANDQDNLAGLYTKVLSSLVALEQQSVSHISLEIWHEHLLRTGFKPSRAQILGAMRFLCNLKDLKDSRLIQVILQHYKNFSVPFSHLELVSEFFVQKRFDQMEHFFRLMLNENQHLSDPAALEDAIAGLLEYCVSFSTPIHTNSIIKMVSKSGMKLNKTAMMTLARFHGMHHRPKALSTILQQLPEENPTTKEDTDEERDLYWAAYLRGKISSSDCKVLVLLKEVRRFHPVLGRDSLQVLIEHAKTKAEAFELLHMLLQQYSNITYRGYAVCVRFIAKQGDAQKAWVLMKACLASETTGTKISDRDAGFLKRNLILGLLEGQNYEELEKRHLDMSLANLATTDTWNLLLRARLSDGRLTDAISGLQEMQIHGLEVENATAQEFMTKILRPRKPGSNPDVLNPHDKRPYLADIKMAISVGHRCLSLGRRTQPETWREVLKRLGLYGEFETLDRVSAWLISQYNNTPPKVGQPPRLFKLSETQHQLPHDNPHRPTARLIRASDICATLTRGFKAGKAVEALNLVVSWQSQGVHVPKDSVKKRLQIGLRYMAKLPRTKSSDIRVLSRELASIFAKLA